jgi:hypothetical protein
MKGMKGEECDTSTHVSLVATSNSAADPANECALTVKIRNNAPSNPPSAARVGGVSYSATSDAGTCSKHRRVIGQ